MRAGAALTEPRSAVKGEMVHKFTERADGTISKPQALTGLTFVSCLGPPSATSACSSPQHERAQRVTGR